MKSLVKFNNWAFGITVGLYLTIYLGMIAQIFLGVIQVFSSLIVLSDYYQKFNSKHKMLFNIYWIAAISNLAILFCINVTQYSPEIIDGISMFGIPMAIAIYYIFILNKISKSHENA